MSPEAFNYSPPLPQNRGLPIGCIGSGFIMAECHLPAYRTAGFNVAAITSRRLESASQVAQRYSIEKVNASAEELLQDKSLQVIDIAVPPDIQPAMIDTILRQGHIRGILAQKPLANSLAQATRLVECCEEAGVLLCVNQNMRYDHSVRALKSLLNENTLGTPVLANIDMHAIPHWMPWQARQGYATCRVMSIHHLDTMRYWFGDPERVYASFRPDPRTQFPHVDGICLYILEYADGLRCTIIDDVWTGPAREGAASDISLNWRVSGTIGLARGTIGWTRYPDHTPSTIDWTTTASDRWHQPRWDDAWFPDAFAGPMGELLIAIETQTQPPTSGRDNLRTLALLDACYESARTHRAVVL